MSSWTLAACAVGVTIRPTTPVGATTAMLARNARIGASVDRQGAEIRAGAGTDDAGRDVSI